MLVDSHCHLDLPELANRLDQVIDSMRQARVVAALCIGVNLEKFPEIMALTDAHDHFYATVGVHPEHKDGEEPDVATLVRLADHPKVLGIGETGLDYYWHKDRPEWQRDRFRNHIRAAIEIHKPLIIHMRDASEDTLRILREEGADAVGGVMHCFTGNRSEASEALSLGFHISFSGIVTFKNARQIKEVAQAIPLHRLLVETDAPYLAPEPFRGKANEPAYVRFVAEEIARLRGMSVEDIERATTENFSRLFGAPIH